MADGVKLPANFFQFPLLMGFKGLSFFGPPFEELRSLALTPVGEVGLIFGPFFVGLFDQGADVIIQIVAHHH